MLKNSTSFLMIQKIKYLLIIIIMTSGSNPVTSKISTSKEALHIVQNT